MGRRLWEEEVEGENASLSESLEGVGFGGAALVNGTGGRPAPRSLRTDGSAACRVPAGAVGHLRPARHRGSARRGARSSVRWSEATRQRMVVRFVRHRSACLRRRLCPSARGRPLSRSRLKGRKNRHSVLYVRWLD